MTFPRELCSTTSNAIPSTNPICGMAPMPRPSIDATAPNSLTHDLSFTPYTFEVRVFNDGVAYRHVIPGEENASRAPDEYSTFVIPDGSRPSSQDDTRTSLVLGARPNTMLCSFVTAQRTTPNWRSRSQLISGAILSPSNCAPEAVSWRVSRSLNSS